MLKVLVVDNNEELLWALKRTADQVSDMVSSAKNEMEAKELIKNNKFDVIVTDLDMGTKEGGFEVLKAAKNEDEHSQVIMVTHFGSKKVSVKSMELGAFDCIDRNSSVAGSLEILEFKIKLAYELRKGKLGKNE